MGIAGEWFSGHGQARILGDFRDPANAGLCAEMEDRFKDWFDPQTEKYPHPYSLLVQVQLEDGELCSQDEVWELDFQNDTARKS